MALLQPLHALVSLPCLSIRQISLPSLSSKSACTSRPTTKCMSMSTGSTSISPNATTVVRRSGNYQPARLDDSYIQSLKSDYVGAAYEQRVDKLKEEVKVMMDHVVDYRHQLELVDTLKRLGLSYHFEHEIGKMLDSIYNNNGDYLKERENDLYATALEFRLLRQHGYNIRQEVFSSFMNESGNFKESLAEDTKGILCLYEASYLLVEDEGILEKAKDFATKHLQNYVDNNKNHGDIVIEMVSHALELPLHWRMHRLETRWFIDVYEKRQDKNHILLELAKLDYNMVQAIYQEDLKNTSKWWTSTGIVENVSFARHRIVENFIWTVGKTPEPQYRNARIIGAQFNALITVIDDVYDVYGTLEELKLFTDIIQRWDTDSVEQLPDFMKTCFRALDGVINEMAPLVLVETPEVNVVYHLRKAWADLCTLYMMEAEWYYSGYKPSFQEYMKTAWVTIAGPMLLIQEYVLTANPVTEEALQCLKYGTYHSIVRWSSMILRLADDLGTSSDELKRGDNPKAIQCYMHDTGASEEDGRNHVRHLISTTWKKLNKDVERIADSPFSKDFARIAMNMARIAQCMYQYGDGHSSQDHVTEDRIQSLLVQPIPL